MKMRVWLRDRRLRIYPVNTCFHVRDAMSATDVARGSIKEGIGEPKEVPPGCYLVFAGNFPTRNVQTNGAVVVVADQDVCVNLFAPAYQREEESVGDQNCPKSLLRPLALYASKPESTENPAPLVSDDDLKTTIGVLVTTGRIAPVKLREELGDEIRELEKNVLRPEENEYKDALARLVHLLP